MKLRNKKTGEIGYFCFANWNDPVLIIMDNDGVQLAKYNSLAEMNENWEDAPEETKEYWYIYGDQVLKNECDGVMEDRFKAIGNYFETEEQAELAVEKLKAWQRLKDKGFRFERWLLGGEYGNTITFSHYIEYDETRADLNLLFGGEDGN